MPLTKVKISQACERSDLSWNRPNKFVIICIFFSVGNTIDVVNNVVSWEMKIANHHDQSFKRARLGTRFGTTLTKVKMYQACERSNLSWNRPSKFVESCSILWCWKYDRGGKQYSISERWKLPIITINLQRKSMYALLHDTYQSREKSSL